MSARRVATFAEIRADVAAVLSRIRYATMTTVDPRGRPRARVLVAVWELDRDEPVGWLATFPTPVKVAHLAQNPHTTLSYWDRSQDALSIDAVAAWIDERATRHRVWQLYVAGSPARVGYDPRPFWPDGPDGSGFAVLRLDPWRVQVLRGPELAAGVPARVWRRPDRD